MLARAYYNEIDPKAAAWLRELIRAGAIAPGEVDERSIEDVTLNDLRGFNQHHFFAGIGVWSYALRLAGWPDDLPVWTGSCPCQPFSQAGKGGGAADERHLWPAWFHLIELGRPAIVFGEQVASPDGLMWLDTVQADLEGAGYAIGAADLCAAGVGAPHIRQRLYFVAESGGQRLEEQRLRLLAGQPRQDRTEAGRSREAHELADTDERTSGQRGSHNGGRHQGSDALARPGSGGSGVSCELADARSDERGSRRPSKANGDRAQQSAGFGHVGVALGDTHHQGSQGRGERRDGADQRSAGSSGVAGFWRDAEWIPCRDGKWRPVEPGTFPLAHGAPARVGRLRGYGNAINAEVAAAFIKAARDALTDTAIPSVTLREE